MQSEGFIVRDLGESTFLTEDRYMEMLLLMGGGLLVIIVAVIVAVVSAVASSDIPTDQS